MNDILSKKKIIKYSRLILEEKNIILLNSVNSTNLYCRELVPLYPSHETLVIANTQTAGRGRMGKTFFSPESTGIYMSLILNCEFINLPINLLTVAAGVAVCRALKTLCSIDANIKWVNDIFVNDRKVCGILAESIACPDTSLHKYIIIGIGINISTPDNIFPDEIKSIAGSIFPKNITRNEIIAQIINELHYIYTENKSNELIAEYKSYSLVLGKEICFTMNGKTYMGIATDINNDGNLVVNLDNGEILILKSGEISLGSCNFTK